MADPRLVGGEPPSVVLLEPVPGERQDLVLGESVQVAVDVAHHLGCDLGTSMLEVRVEAILEVGLSVTVSDETNLRGIGDLVGHLFEESRIVVVDVVSSMLLRLSSSLVLAFLARPIETFRIGSLVESTAPHALRPS